MMYYACMIMNFDAEISNPSYARAAAALDVMQGDKDRSDCVRVSKYQQPQECKRAAKQGIKGCSRRSQVHIPNLSECLGSRSK